MKYDVVSDGKEGRDPWVLGLKTRGFRSCLIEKLSHFGVFQNEIPSHSQWNAVLLTGTTSQKTAGLIAKNIPQHGMSTYMDCEVVNMG